jgi:penicillin-binding protein 2
LGEPWYPGETISAGIGQGYMLATPLQLAQAAMVLANKGESFVPSVVHRVDDLTVGGVQRPRIPMDEADWQAVVEGMVDVGPFPSRDRGGDSEGYRIPNCG